MLLLGILVWLANNLHQVGLESLLLELKSVLVPDEVGYFRIPTVLLHATLEESQNVFVVWVFNELKFSAIVHVLLEFFRVSLTKLIDSDFKLLLFDIAILFVL